MKIHQIYFDFGKGKKYTETPTFVQSIQEWRHLCENNKYEYHFWGEELKPLLLGFYPQYKSFTDKLNNPQKHDFFRFLCLYHFGGLYMDMDVLPKCSDLEWVEPRMVRKDDNCKKKGIHIGIDFLSFEKGDEIIGERYFKSIEDNYNEKYDTYKKLGWEGRFVLQTTGPYHFTRYIKHNFKDKLKLFSATTIHNDTIKHDEPDTKLLIKHTCSWVGYTPMV
jgi:mannosyltransferase OCH1-like enzyme